MLNIIKCLKDIANRFKDVGNWIVKEYDSGNWHVIEYHDGEVELFYRKDKVLFTKDSSGGWGYSYRSGLNTLSFPLTLSKIEFVRGSTVGSYAYNPDISGLRGNAVDYYLVSYAHDWSTVQVSLLFYIRGKLGG